MDAMPWSGGWLEPAVGRRGGGARLLISRGVGASFISTMLWHIDSLSRVPLQDQIAGCVRRAIATGQLGIGEQLPPAVELAEALSVDRNTVLAAYRQLRDVGLLEFRRGRGARVARAAPPAAAVREAARVLVELGNDHGFQRAELIQLIEELT